MGKDRQKEISKLEEKLILAKGKIISSMYDLLLDWEAKEPVHVGAWRDKLHLRYPLLPIKTHPTALPLFNRVALSWKEQVCSFWVLPNTSLSLDA